METLGFFGELPEALTRGGDWRYRSYRIEGRGGPEDSYGDACAAAQAAYDREFARLERYVQRLDGEIRFVFSYPERTWTRGQEPDLRHYCQIVSRVDVRLPGTVALEALEDYPGGKDAAEAAADKQTTVRVDAIQDLVARLQPILQARFGHGFFADWKVAGGRVAVDFDRAQRLPERVREITRRKDNSQGTTPISWTMEFDETVESRQEITITRSVTDSKNASLRIDYRGSGASGEVMREVNVQQSFSQTVTQVHRLTETYASEVPQGVARTATFRIVTGEMVVPLEGRIVYDVLIGVPKRNVWDGGPQYRPVWVSEFLPEAERSYPVEGTSFFATFSDSELVVVDETP